MPAVTPAATLYAGACRPVSGLTSGFDPWPAPSHAIAQWRVAGFLLVYRCGGSVGIALRRTDFPFHSSDDCPWNT